MHDIKLPQITGTKPVKSKDSHIPVGIRKKEKPIILLAEDNEANINTVTDYLIAHGYEMARARNGLEAVEMTRNLNPHIVLMDIQML